MLSKTLVGLATLALAQEALAGSAHRHGLQHLHKRGSTLTEVEVVTDVVTTTVWIGGEPTPTSTVKAKAFYTASRRRSSKASSHVSTATSTSTSSSTSTTPSTTSTSTSVPEPVVAPTTTLVTEAKVAAVETTAAVTPVTSVPVAVDIVASVTAAVAAVTSAAAAAVSSAVSSTTSSDKKRGLAYNDHSLLSGFLGSSSKVSWKYNWAQSDDGGSTGIEFVPMLWGTGSNHEPTWSANAEKAISAGSSHFLSFNEPDNAGQANMSPATAAAAHIRLMNPYSGRVKIGSPAITNSNNAGEGIDWIKSFFTACNSQCDVDFVAVHWYNAPDTTEFLQHLVNVHNAVNLPIWITEFAPTGSDSQINSFLTTVMAELDSNPTYSFVERYSYFMVSANSLISSGTTLSTFGQTFAFA